MAEMNKDTATLLQEMIDVKKGIRTSISNKGVDVVGGMVTYPDAIDRISGITGVDSNIDYTQIGWTLNNSNEQNEMDAQYINKGLEYTKTLMDKGDASKWETNNNGYTYSPFTEDVNLIFAPFVYNIGDKRIGQMFDGCVSLRAVPLFDTSNMVGAYNMFAGCSSLISVPQFNTSNVTNMYGMFQECRSLKTISLLNTSNVTNMSNMFDGCSSLISISQLDTSKVTDMRDMFYGCSSLTSIPLLDTSNVTDMYGMFNFCESLETVPLLDATKCDPTEYNYNQLFLGCKKLKNFGGLKGWKYDLDLSDCTELTYESLMNVINNLGEPINSGTLLTISDESGEKLSDDDITVLIDKGWYLSVV